MSLLLQETLNYWKQLPHVLKYFREKENPTARLPQSFMQGFLEVRWLVPFTPKVYGPLKVYCRVEIDATIQSCRIHILVTRDVPFPDGTFYTHRRPCAVQLGLHLRCIVVPSGGELRFYYITELHQVVKAFLQCIVHGCAIWNGVVKTLDARS